MGSNRRNANLRSASFSEYLHDVSEDSVHRPAESLPEYELPLPRIPRKVDLGDHEIDVFDAKKYFNTNPDVKFVRDKEEHHHVPGRKPGTPRVTNEISSSMITTFLGSDAADARHLEKKTWEPRRRRIFSGFSCSGYCSDSNSVQVNEETETKKPGSDQIMSKATSVSGSDRTVEFEFPILNAGELMEETRSSSLDLFRSDANKAKGEDVVVINLERKVSMLSWDAIPKARNIPVPPTIDVTRADEMDSCGSSDLFEIESISAMCRDALLRPARSDGPSEKEVSKKSGLSKLSMLGCKNPGAVNAAEPGKEIRPR